MKEYGTKGSRFTYILSLSRYGEEKLRVQADNWREAVIVIYNAGLTIVQFAWPHERIHNVTGNRLVYKDGHRCRIGEEN